MSRLIGRPPKTGAIGDVMAVAIFGIALERACLQDEAVKANPEGYADVQTLAGRLVRDLSGPWAVLRSHD